MTSAAVRPSGDKADSELKMADMPTGDDFARLESEIETDPTSEAAREARVCCGQPSLRGRTMQSCGSTSEE
jgi:hypothetical protein